MNYRNTCPKCGPMTLQRKFNFCPKCGSTVKEADLKTISSSYHPTRMPKEVENILEKAGAKTDSEKREILNSIVVTKEPRNIISENVGGISKVDR
jgi:uncharacterized Zn finger protein (UPF0148 family)